MDRVPSLERLRSLKTGSSHSTSKLEDSCMSLPVKTVLVRTVRLWSWLRVGQIEKSVSKMLT